MATNEENNNNIHHANEPEFDEITHERLLAGHDYDGIRELDNDLPPWWKYLFYITIIFAVVFLLVYHVFKAADLQDVKYEKEMAAAAKLYKREDPAKAAASLTVLSDDESLADGKATFDKICHVCHGKFGEGLIGPNFTDEYWIHGGTIQLMYKVVINGVLEKGMISYKDQLSPKQIQNVLSYIISLKGSNPPNPKAPEGERWVNGEKVSE